MKNNKRNMDETPLEKPKKVQSVEDMPLEKPKTPEDFDQNESTAGIKLESVVKSSPEEETMGKGLLGFIFIFAIVSIMAYFIWFHKSPEMKSNLPVKPTGEVTGQTTEDAKLAEALTKVKENQGVKTRMTLSAILESYKFKKEKEKIKIAIKGWQAKPSEAKEEPLRFYDVTYEWSENGNPIVFAWQADLKTGKVQTLNQNAREIDKHEETLWATLAKVPETNVPTPPVGSATPRIPVKDPTAPVTLKPVNSKPVDIDILPPEIPPGNATPAPTKGPKKPVEPALPPSKPPKFESGDEFYQLTGIMSSSGTKTAMLNKNGKVFSGASGTTLPDGWRITSLSDNTVTLKKGSETRVVNIKDSVHINRPVVKKTPEYPKAKSKDKKGKVKDSGHPEVPSPDAPPVPPGPNEDGPKPEKTDEPKDTKPTVIPID